MNTPDLATVGLWLLIKVIKREEEGVYYRRGA
jgi:hypothetical protein